MSEALSGQLWNNAWKLWLILSARAYGTFINILICGALNKTTGLELTKKVKDRLVIKTQDYPI